METNSIAIIGTGYVGLYTALGFAKAKQNVIAFDIDKDRIDNLKHHIDLNHEIVDFNSLPITFTHNLNDINSATHYIITVPTPVDKYKNPNLSLVITAAEEIGPFIKPGDTVICESTVYPGTTEEVVLPILESKCRLKAGIDFYLGFSSERINPGDTQHCFNNIAKVFAGINDASTEKLKALYQCAINAPLFAAPSIKVAEASKLLENIQRDVNIALMNECVKIMDKMDISLLDVIDAAATKWNFIPYKPGFVGGHCIAVDPYYLIERAKRDDVDTPLISTARSINDEMVEFIYKKAMTFCEDKKKAKIAILGLAYKKNTADCRNSLAIELLYRIRDKAVVSSVDPLVIPEHLDFPLTSLSQLKQQDLIIICVVHDQFQLTDWTKKLKPRGGIIDLTGMLRDKKHLLKNWYYWSP